MNRKDLQYLARIRFKEANSLLAAGCPEGAYYLAGYAVECALKACIAKRTQRYDFPDRKSVDASYTHNLKDLIKVANLEGAHLEEAKSDPFKTRAKRPRNRARHPKIFGVPVLIGGAQPRPLRFSQQLGCCSAMVRAQPLPEAESRTRAGSFASDWRPETWGNSLDKTALVEASFTGGADLLRALDQSALPISVALWLYSPEYEDWRFVLASRRLDAVRPADAYGLVHEALASAGVTLEKTPPLLILEMSDPFIRALRRMFSAVKSVEGMRLGSQLIGAWR